MYNILQKYTKIYRTQRKVIEEALKLLEKHYEGYEKDEIMWLSSKQTSDIVGIPRRILVKLIEGDVEGASKDRIADSYFEWLLKKPIKNSDIREVANAIKEGFTLNNLFRAIDISVNNENLEMIFWHSMGCKVSDFFAKTLKDMIEKRCRREVKIYLGPDYFKLMF